MDVIRAILNGIIEGDVIMEIPQGFAIQKKLSMVFDSHLKQLISS